MENISPDFDKIISKSLEFSNNLILFLPKNTSIENLISRMIPYYKHWPNNKNELLMEIEQLIYFGTYKIMIVYTGELIKFSS